MGRELSIEMKSAQQNQQLTITSVENISSAHKISCPKKILPETISAHGDHGHFSKKQIQKDADEDSFEHISDEN